jgi:hypothetical protein
MAKKPEFTAFLVRLPNTMKIWIEKQAERNGAS